MNANRIVKLAAAGGAIGIAVSIAAHYSPAVLAAAGALGTLCSLVVGAAYGARAEAGRASAAAGGALSGAGCALVGIGAGVALGNQPLFVLAAGTAGGAVAGTLGALVARYVGGRRHAAAR